MTSCFYEDVVHDAPLIAVAILEQLGTCQVEQAPIYEPLLRISSIRVLHIVFDGWQASKHVQPMEAAWCAANVQALEAACV